MRFAASLFCFLVLPPLVLIGQGAIALSAGIHQVPDADGVYYTGPEVSAPRLLRTSAVPYPKAIAEKDVQGFTVVALVIDAAGHPQHIQLLHSHGDLFDRPAIAAVKGSIFEPGRLAGKPVPVWIDVRVVFRANRADAFPEVLITERDLPTPDPSKLVDKHGKPLPYIAPLPIHTVDADFVDPFAKTNPWTQVAVVDVLVGTNGLPKDVHVRRGLGFGLDEKASAAVWHYRFLPATEKGKTIEARRNIMVNFVEF
jgi:TonB family protein